MTEEKADSRLLFADKGGEALRYNAIQSAF